MEIPPGEAPLSYLAYALPPRPEEVTADDILDRFLDFVEYAGLALYPAQETAILELYAENNVILATPTGSGKSLVATALHFYAIGRARRSFYTAPVKALVNEKFFALCRDFGPSNVGMLTGDAVVNPDAPILCCTQEILASFALREGAALDAGHIVIDEFHYYADRDRGTAWQVPLLALPNPSFLLMSATFGEPSFFVDELTRRTGRPTAVVAGRDRPVPLDFEYRETPLHETIHSLVREQKSPVYVVAFTQRAVAEEAQNLLSVDFVTREQKQSIKDALHGVRFDSPYGKELARTIRHGVGLHHAGLLPKYRLLVEKLAQRGLLAIVVGTDTLGVGVNIPIRTVLFTQLCKYDGQKTALLRARDFHQIAGRAGRRGFDTRGSVVAQAPPHVIENLRLETKAGNDPVKRKRIVRKKPPERGYVHWDRAVFERLVAATPEALVSRFEVSHGMLIQVLQRRRGCRAMVRLIHDCHETPRQKQRLRTTTRQMVRSLLEAEIIHPERDGGVSIHADLQEDFSLHRALSLFLVELVDALDPEHPTYALDVLSLVEAIVEDPEIVLMRQLDKIKTEKLAELKAAGVEYEERVEILNKLDLPRPQEELLQATFETFSQHHPWVVGERIRPKSVARTMIEQFLSFGEFVREYGLERSEGVLLRYLSSVFKTLSQTVPDQAKTQDLVDVETYLRAIVRATDTSLLDEWDNLQRRTIPDRDEPASIVTAADRVDITHDEPVFTVLVRNAAFAVIRALARQDWAGATALLDGAAPDTVRERLAAFSNELGRVRADPEARGPRHFRVVSRDDRAWVVEQLLLGDARGGTDGEEPLESDWFLRLEVNLAATREVGHPVLALEHFGP
ncbi:MAG: DUF3516 domain-containing protein [Polyangiaceae bacterium]|nr:DUF3516 domain-containing protein [Polyangiaceae bacterium]